MTNDPAKGVCATRPRAGWRAMGTERTMHSIERLEFKGPSLSPFIDRWLHAGSSNMAVLEVPLLSGFRADVESLEQVRGRWWAGAGQGLWTCPGCRFLALHKMGLCFCFCLTFSQQSWCSGHLRRGRWGGVGSLPQKVLALWG